VLAIAVPLAFLVATDTWKRFLLIGVLVFVMVVELLNTSIEKSSPDRVNREIDPQIGRGQGTSARPPVGLAADRRGAFACFSRSAERLGLM